MHNGHGKGQEKHNQNLTVNGFFDFRLAKTDLLHDFEAFLVLIALGKLLVIYYEYRCHQENQTQKQTQKQMYLTNLSATC